MTNTTYLLRKIQQQLTDNFCKAIRYIFYPEEKQLTPDHFS